MAELANCARCSEVFVKGTRAICPRCYREEEKAFETVDQFLRERKNREATLLEIVEATGVEEEQIISFIKRKRLLPSQFPNLGYPCEKCDTPITSGKLCTDCSKSILKAWERHEKMEQRQKEREEAVNKRSRVYYAVDQDKK